jgi:N-carbamoylputrescine amidase
LSEAGDQIRIAPVSATPVALDAIGRAAGAGADLILLPQLSFTPYFPARRDRDALELGEREPFPSLRPAAERAGDSLLFASVYECVGEGVFYARADLLSGGESLGFERQRVVEAAPGRYEQMFFSPGHGARRVIPTPWGPVGMLLGADARDPRAYFELAQLGACLVVGGTSEGERGWKATTGVAAGMAAGLGIAVALVNRSEDGEPGFPGGSCAFSPGGEALELSEDGAFTAGLASPDKEAT